MINRLSEFLRLTLDNAETHVLSLEDEIEFMRRYLEIELIRFHDRLTVAWDIDPQALEAQVPNLILQPLVENAMRHGIDSHLDEGRIEISVHLENGNVRLEVCDNGKELKKSAEQSGTGLGLKNTRSRLSELYSGNYNFNLIRREEWTIAQIVIPFLPLKNREKRNSNE
jgi:LytS/YehU family sensor histidine kinase